MVVCRHRELRAPKFSPSMFLCPERLRMQWPLARYYQKFDNFLSLFAEWFWPRFAKEIEHFFDNFWELEKRVFRDIVRVAINNEQKSLMALPHKLHFSAPFALLCAVISVVECAHLSTASRPLRDVGAPAAHHPGRSLGRGRSTTGADRTQRAAGDNHCAARRWCEDGALPLSGRSTQPNPCCGLGQPVRIPAAGFLPAGSGGRAARRKRFPRLVVTSGQSKGKV